MPWTEVFMYRAADGTIPVLVWLSLLARRDPSAARKCRRQIKLLQAQGFELRRPHADYLRDAVYELRVRHGRVHYRLLYSFCGRNTVVVSNAFSKEGEVPDFEIETAVRRRLDVEADPDTHAVREWMIDE